MSLITPLRLSMIDGLMVTTHVTHHRTPPAGHFTASVQETTENVPVLG